MLRLDLSIIMYLIKIFGKQENAILDFVLKTLWKMGAFIFQFQMFSIVVCLSRLKGASMKKRVEIIFDVIGTQERANVYNVSPHERVFAFHI